MSFRIQPIQVLKLLLYAIAVLLTLNLFFAYLRLSMGHDFVFGLAPMFDLNLEMNIPTAFSFLLLVISSLLLLFIAMNRYREAKNYRYWLALSLGFAFMALDEFTSLHENLGAALEKRQLFQDLAYHQWLVPYGVGVMVLAITFYPFLLHLDPRVRRLFLMSGVLYLFGVMGLEWIGSLVHNYMGMANWAYTVLYSLEESLEMIGVSLFIYTLLKVMQNHGWSLQVNFPQY